MVPVWGNRGEGLNLSRRTALSCFGRGGSQVHPKRRALETAARTDTGQMTEKHTARTWRDGEHAPKVTN